MTGPSPSVAVCTQYRSASDASNFRRSDSHALTSRGVSLPRHFQPTALDAWVNAGSIDATDLLRQRRRS